MARTPDHSHSFPIAASLIADGRSRPGGRIALLLPAREHGARRMPSLAAKSAVAFVPMQGCRKDWAVHSKNSVRCDAAPGIHPSVMYAISAEEDIAVVKEPTSLISQQCQKISANTPTYKQYDTNSSHGFQGCTVYITCTDRYQAGYTDNNYADKYKDGPHHIMLAL